MNSIWTETVKMPEFEPLEGEVHTDVLIIGGGITGLLCAHFLEKSGVEYLLVEGRTICSGITKTLRLKLPPSMG